MVPKVGQRATESWKIGAYTSDAGARWGESKLTQSLPAPAGRNPTNHLCKRIAVCKIPPIGFLVRNCGRGQPRAAAGSRGRPQTSCARLPAPARARPRQPTGVGVRHRKGPGFRSAVRALRMILGAHLARRWKEGFPQGARRKPAQIGRRYFHQTCSTNFRFPNGPGFWAGSRKS